MALRSPPTPNASTRPTGSSNINSILNPTRVFDQDARKFLSSRACERQTDVIDDRDQHDRDYDLYRARSPASPRGNYESDRYATPRQNGATSPAINGSGTNHYSMQRQYAAEIGRSSTAVPVNRSSSIYPSAMLPNTRTSSPYGDLQRPSAYHGQVRPPSAMSGVTTSSSASSASSSRSPTSSSQATSPPDSPVYGSPRHHVYNGYGPTNGHSANGYSNQHDYARGATNGSSRHSHSHSYSANAYATDHKPSRLVPTRHSTGGSIGGRGAANLPAVLPRPPNTSGSSTMAMNGRRGTVGRSSLSMSARSGRIDDDDMAAHAVNTYRQSGPTIDL